MRRVLTIFLFAAASLAAVSCRGGKKADFDPAKTAYVTFKTNLGDVTIRLFDDTPLHRDNMIRLVQERAYDSVIFHRIVRDFVIQGGNLDNTLGADGELYSSGDADYTIPAEILPHYFNRRGVVLDAKMADNVNPERASAGTQFCFLQGRVMTDAELDETEARINNTEINWLYYKNLAQLRRENPEMAEEEIDELAARMAGEEMERRGPITIPVERREIYKTVGGAPHLDGSVTIFGEVVEGFDTMDKMNAVATERDSPLEPVIILSAELSNRPD